MVVLRRDEDEGIIRGNLRGPLLGVGLLILAHRWRDRFVEQRKLEIVDVDEFVLGVAALSPPVPTSPRRVTVGSDGCFL